MQTKLSRSQVDRLGDRIRGGEITEADLQLLDAYRRSFSQPYEDVVAAVRQSTGFDPTGRPTKSTTSISDKLARERIRLSQMQDIAGCRIVVPDVMVQDEIVSKLKVLFETQSIFDRREKPSHGYRAVHVVVRRFDLPIEIQIRTAIQHLWAELSEKLSDVVDPSVKYGGGPDSERDFLGLLSDLVLVSEGFERDLLLKKAELAASSGGNVADFGSELTSREEKLREIKQELVELLEDEAQIWADD